MKAVIIGRPTICRSGIAYLLEHVLDCTASWWFSSLKQARRADLQDVQLVCIETELAEPGSREFQELLQVSKQGALIVYGRMSDDAQGRAVQLASLGIAGFLDVTRPIGEIGEKLQRLAGTTFLCRKEGINLQAAEDRRRYHPAEHLTPRERQVMKLVSQGETTKSIAHILNLSYHTIEFYRKRIMRKTGATSVALLTRLALRSGITFLWE